MSDITEDTRTMSADIGELAGALAAAQGAIEGAAKDKTNPHFRNNYADLASVWDACRAALSKNKLAVVQTTEHHDALVVVVTTLIHASGQWMRGRLPMHPVKADPQGVGSAITYARRYALAAIVGVAPEDDDAEAAQGRSKTGATKTEGAAKPKPKPITAQQAQTLREELAETASDETRFCAYFQVATLEALPAAQFERALQALDKKASHTQANNTQPKETA